MQVLTKDNFEQETNEGLVLVDFFADWCGPCKMLAPVLEKVAEELAGKVKVVKVNVDDEMELAQKFQVVSIPTLVLLKDGNVVNTTMGYQPANNLKSFIESGF